MRRFLSLFSVIVLLFATSCTSKADPNPDEGKETIVRGKYRVGSFNIRYFNDVDGEYVWSNRYPAVNAFFAEEKPDIIGLQEIRDGQIADLKAIEGYDSFFIFRNSGTSTPANSDDEGNGIMWDKSRFTLADYGFFWLSTDPDHKPVWNSSYDWGTTVRRIAVYVKLLDKKQYDMPVYFYATHFDHQKANARVEEAKVILQRMKLYLCVENLSTLSDRVFLVGDLNSDFKENAYSTLAAELGSARDNAPLASQAATFNDFGGKYNGAVLDHIFYGGPCQPLSFRVISKDYGIKYISDHYPVILDLN